MLACGWRSAESTTRGLIDFGETRYKDVARLWI